MKFLLLLLSLFLLTMPVLTQTDASPDTETPERVPWRVIAEEDIRVALHFPTLLQGRVGLMTVEGENITTVSARLFNREHRCFEDEGVFICLLVTPIEQSAREYALSVVAGRRVGAATELLIGIQVENGGFIRQDVVLREDQMGLLDPIIEQEEFATIFSFANRVTEEKLWDARGFIVPINAPLTSPFGAVRTFNDTFNTRHTGWDFQVPIGKPMMASATGKVVFAGLLPIRGQYVLVDHGQGVYSGYAHLSVTHVAQGQPVRAGQIIGQVGSTGRSSSAHAHIEFIVGGEWIDPIEFIRMMR